MKVVTTMSSFFAGKKELYYSAGIQDGLFQDPEE
jgi:hypothetical protein